MKKYVHEWIQWNPANTDTKGTCHSVRIICVLVLSGLSAKTSRTYVLSIQRPKQTVLRENVVLFLNCSTKKFVIKKPLDDTWNVLRTVYCTVMETGRTVDSFEKICDFTLTEAFSLRLSQVDWISNRTFAVSVRFSLVRHLVTSSSITIASQFQWFDFRLLRRGIDLNNILITVVVWWILRGGCR